MAYLDSTRFAPTSMKTGMPEPFGVEPPSPDRRRLLTRSAGLFAAYGLLQFSGCTSLSTPLSIGAHVWPGYEFLFLANDEGWFDSREIRLLETTSASASLEALAGGAIDAAALTLDEVLRSRLAGVPSQVVLVFDVSAGADVVLAKHPVKVLSDLKGRRIGVEADALGFLMLRKTLSAAGLVEDDVMVVPVEVNGHLRAWSEDLVDVLVTYEPTAHKLLSKGAIRIFDSRMLPDTIFDVLVINSRIAEMQADRVRSLISAYFRARHLWQSNPIDSAYRMAGHLGVEAERVQQLFSGLELPDEAYNRHLLSAPATELRRAVDTLLPSMPETVRSAPADTYRDLFTAEYLPKLRS